MSVDRVLLPLLVKPVHYKLELVPDLESLKYSCTEEIDVVVTATTNEIKLHSKEIFIVSASFVSKEGDKTATEAIEISYNLKDTTVNLKFADNLSLGNGTVLISFNGILNGDMAGFYKSGYADASGKKCVMASTQFEALDARRAFPCWDEPAVKATFAVTIIIPSYLSAISNMPELSTQHLPGGKKKVVFDVSPKMSTYLLAWAIGEFDYLQSVTKNGVTVRVFCPPGRAQQGQFALETGKACLDFYDDFFLIKYPLPKLDMICITEFAMGAMENWGLVTYREVDLMIDEATASPQQKQRVSEIVAHELAHQWFGNLVTMQWWDDLWLNEGFATFMQNLATNKLCPEYHLWEQYSNNTMGAAFRLDSLRSSHPIQVPIVRAEEVEQVFDAISYNKGSIVIRMVSAVLGEEKFREGLQVYLKRHQYGNTVTGDLWQAWSEVSGIDIPGLMASWTLQMGFPYLTVVDEQWRDGSVTVTLEQSWFLTDGSGATGEGGAKLWSIPLFFATSSSESSSAVMMTDKRQTFTVPASDSASEWLKINAGQKALVRVSYSPTMTARLQGAVRSKALCPEDRAALILDSYALAKAGVAPVESVIEILRAYDQEDNNTVWSAIASVLSALQLLLDQVGGGVADSFTAFAKGIIKSAFQKVGWAPAGGVVEGHAEKLLRATLLGLIESFCHSDEDVQTAAKIRFDAHWDNPAELPTEYKNIVYRIVLMNGGQEEYEKILATYYSTEDNTIRKHVMLTLGATQVPKLQLRTMEWAVEGKDVKLQDFFYPIYSLASTSSSGSKVAWEYVKKNIDYIKTKLEKASPSLMGAVIAYALSRHCTLEHADEIEDFFAAHPIPSVSRKIGQTVEGIRSSGAMLKLLQASRLVESSYWD